MIECSQFWEANQIVENVLRNTDRIAVGLCGHMPSGAEASGNIVDMENLLMHQTVQMSRVDFSPQWSGDSGDSWASGPAILWTLAPIQVHTIRVKDAFVLGSQLLPKQTVIN